MFCDSVDTLSVAQISIVSCIDIHAYCLLGAGFLLSLLLILRTEAVRSPETSVVIYHSIRSHIAKNNTLHTLSRVLDEAKLSL
jgi:hypothetical protein